jgi:hypothetical protein
LERRVMPMGLSSSDVWTGGYLEMWARDYAGPPELMVSAARGAATSECETSWLTVEGPAAFGHLTLWESGIVAVEIYEVASAETLLRSRLQVTSMAELASQLSAFVEVCATGFGPCLVAGAVGWSGQRTPIREPTTLRHLNL